MIAIKFLHSILFGYLLNDYLQRHYAEVYKEYTYYVLYSVMRTFSILEIQYNKMINVFVINDSAKENNDASNNNIHFLKNGKIYNTINILNEDDLKNNMYMYSKLFVKETNSESLPEKYYLKKLLKEFPTEELTIEETSVQFILVEIIVGDNIYNVKMKDDKFFVQNKTQAYSYYIVDNVLDKHFFMYYFHNHTRHQIDFDNEPNLIARIIDHNVVTVELDLNNQDYITLTKDDYVTQKTEIVII